MASEVTRVSFHIVHQRGRKHTNADSLSRLPCKQYGYQPSEQIPVTAVSLQMGITSAELHKLQQEDSMIHPVLASKISGEKPKPDQIKQYSLHTNRLFALWDQLILKDNVLYRHFVTTNGSNDHLQFVVPKSLQENVLKQTHDHGHLGQEKTLSRVKQKFYWPGHFNDIKNWCNTCPLVPLTRLLIPSKKQCFKPCKLGTPYRS